MKGDYYKFFYFFNYLGFFPAMSTYRPLPPNKMGAEEVLTRHPANVFMEMRTSFRLGDHAKLFLFYPDYYLRGMTEPLSVRPFAIGYFVLALVSLYCAFCLQRLPITGLMLVLFLGSHPAQLYQVYARDNIFSFPVSTMIIVLALNLSTIVGTWCGWFSYLMPVLSALLLGTMAHVGTENVAGLPSVLFCYVFFVRVHLVKKIALIGLLVIGYMITTVGWQHYFDTKYRVALRRVTEIGGNPYRGPYRGHHHIWHALFMGLSDFDTRHGYTAWADSIAYNYAIPVLHEKNIQTDGVYDNTPQYDIFYEDIPEYMEVLRNRVVSDITTDPIWYAEIIFNRIMRVVCDTTPVNIELGYTRLNLPAGGILAFVACLVLAICRRWDILKVVCFTLPLAAPAIIIYSGLGMCLYSCYHVVAVAFLLSIVFELAYGAVGRCGHATACACSLLLLTILVCAVSGLGNKTQYTARKEINGTFLDGTVRPVNQVILSYVAQTNAQPAGVSLRKGFFFSPSAGQLDNDRSTAMFLGSNVVFRAPRMIDICFRMTDLGICEASVDATNDIVICLSDDEINVEHRMFEFLKRSYEIAKVAKWAIYRMRNSDFRVFRDMEVSNLRVFGPRRTAFLQTNGFRLVYLADMTNLTPSNLYAGRNGLLGRGVDHSGKPVVVFGIHSKKAVSTHPGYKNVAGTVAVPLDGKFRRFRSLVGMTSTEMGSVTFKVFVDGKESYSSGAFSSRHLPALIDISVASATQLVLYVDSGIDHSIWGDDATWIDPYLTEED